MPVTNQALAGGYQLLNYRIDRQISRGGFSIVYRAFDEEGSPVAIKEYLPSSLVLRTEGDIVRALDAWKSLCEKTGAEDPVFVTAGGEPIDPREATDAYRSMLHAALIAAEADRPELWTKAAGRKELRLHDARASFVTVALLSGRSKDWVRRRSKHKSSAIERYRRHIGTFRELELGDWVPLDGAIPEIAAVVTERTAAPAAKTAAEAAAETPSKGPVQAAARTQNRKSPGVPDSVGARGFEPPTPRPPV